MILVLLLTFPLFLLLRIANADDRPILIVLSLSYLYYCLGSPLYWIYGLGGNFGGVNWDQGELVFAAVILAISTLMLMASIVYFSKGSKLRPVGFASAPFQDVYGARKHSALPNSYWVAAAVGLAASLYVLVKGSFSGQVFIGLRDPYILIAYQLGDILVAVIMYTIATRGYTKLSISLIAYFTIYAVFVGFRYKLALIFIPLVMQQLSGKQNLRTRSFTIGLFGLGGLFLFTVMTLYRNKFGIPDFSARLTDPVSNLIYGFFAEGNIIFLLASIIRNYAYTFSVYPIDPVLDTIKEMVPRVIFPSRVTGAYALPAQIGLISTQAITSGTAYPWIGEFMIMFGFLGVIIGPVAIAMLYHIFKSKLRNYTFGRPKLFAEGLFILAALMGYYHYSRGYFPQIAKAYICILVPYIYFCYASTPKPAVMVSGRRMISPQINKSIANLRHNISK